jgi:hypothetical protein
MTDRLRHAFSGRGSCSGRGLWTVVKFAAQAEFDFSPDPDPMLYEKMRLPGRNRRTAARPASDPDALLTPPGIIQQGSPIFFLQAQACNRIVRRIDLGANRPCRINVCENQPVKNLAPAADLEVGYKFLITNR